MSFKKGMVLVVFIASAIFLSLQFIPSSPVDIRPDKTLDTSGEVIRKVKQITKKSVVIETKALTQKAKLSPIIEMQDSSTQVEASLDEVTDGLTVDIQIFPPEDLSEEAVDTLTAAVMSEDEFIALMEEQEGFEVRDDIEPVVYKEISENSFNNNQLVKEVLVKQAPLSEEEFDQLMSSTVEINKVVDEINDKVVEEEIVPFLEVQ